MFYPVPEKSLPTLHQGETLIGGDESSIRHRRRISCLYFPAVFRLLAALLLCTGIFSLGIFSICKAAEDTIQTAQHAVNTPPPAPMGHEIYVTDLGHLLMPQDQAAITDQLERLDQAGVAQIAVVTLPATDRELSEFSPQIMNIWKIGLKSKNNGLLILVNADALRGHKQRNRIFIGTGSGLEGDLPDVTLGKFLDAYAIPAFEAGQYSQGIRDVTLAIAGRLAQGAGMQSGETGRANLPMRESRRAQQAPLWVSIIKVLFFLLVLWISFRSRGFLWLGGFGGGFGGFGDGGDDDGGGFGGGGSSGGGAGR